MGGATYAIAVSYVSESTGRRLSYKQGVFDMHRFLLILCLVGAGFAQGVPQAAAPASPSSNVIKDARKLQSDGKYDEAIAAFEKIAKSDPKNWEAHAGIGNALDLKGDYA